MSTENQPTEAQEEMTLEENNQRLIESIAEMRVKFPKHIGKLDEKIVKINTILFKKKIKSQHGLKMRIPKYSIERFNPELVDVYKNIEMKHKECSDKLKHFEKLQKVAQQLKNDLIGKIIREDIDSETLLRRVKLKMEEDAKKFPQEVKIADD